MVLVNPPSVRNCEPPPGLARLAGALMGAGEPVHLIDGAQEGWEMLLRRDPATREKGDRIVKTLTTARGYSSFDRYKKNLSDMNFLAGAALPDGIRLTPADYRDASLSPLRSDDIRHVLEHPEENPFFPWFEHRFDDLFAGGETRLGISLGFQSQVLTAAALMGYVKRQYPGVSLALGGGMISSWARSPGLEKLPFPADALIAGRGEEAIVRFCGREWAGEGQPFYGDLYRNRYIAPVPILPYSASDSCSWKRCTFCAERWEDYPYRERDRDRTLADLRELGEKHAIGMIHLTDSEISPALLAGLAVNPPGIPWYGFSRFLNEMTDPDYCRRLARSGCRMLCMGLESGDQGVLNALKKGIRLDHVSAILRNLKEAGIGTFLYLLFGTPAEDRDAALRSRDFVLANRDHIDFMNLAVFTMPRVSGETSLVETGEFYEGDLSQSVDFLHPSGWSRRRVREFLDRDFRGIPVLRTIDRRMPPVYTSSHAPFFLKSH